jgi:hypothetical protein
MRAIVWLSLLSGLFCAYWFGAAYLLRTAPAYVSDRGAQVAGVDVTGFPTAFDLRLDTPALPARGWRADWAALSIPSYWPFSAQGALSGQQRFRWRGAEWRLTGTDMPLSLDLTPGLTVTRAALSGRDMSLAGSIGAQLGALNLTLEPTGTAQVYQLSLDLSDLTLAEIGHQLNSASLRATLQFEPPMRLTARGALTAIELTEVRMVSGISESTITGRLSRRADGLWDGTLALAITNWQPLMTAFQDSGLLAPDQARLISMMAQGMSEGDRLTLPLTVAGSILSLGPIPLLDLGGL